MFIKINNSFMDLTLLSIENDDIKAKIHYIFMNEEAEYTDYFFTVYELQDLIDSFVLVFENKMNGCDDDFSKNFIRIKLDKNFQNLRWDNTYTIEFSFKHPKNTHAYCVVEKISIKKLNEIIDELKLFLKKKVDYEII